MTQILDFDLKRLVLVNDTFGPREVRQMQDAIARDFSQYQVLRDSVNELQAKEEQTPASNVRLGVCLYLLGRYYRAIEVLRQADGGALAHFFLAKALFAREEYAAAIECYQAAEKAGYDVGDCYLGWAEALRYSGKAADALAVLDRLSGAIEQTADYLAQRRHGIGLGRQSSGSHRTLRTGRGSRPQSSRGPVRLGHGKRSAWQRRDRHGIVQAGRGPFSR